MSRIHGMMDIGRRAMSNSQTALQTTGHNIANQGVEGYSRQRVEIQTAEPITYGRLRMGMGSRAASVTRTNNPYLEKQIGKEQALLGLHQGRSDGMMRVEQVFNEHNGKGLNTYMSDFFNSFREFANNPESLASRTNVRETADVLVKDFHRVNKHLKEIQRDIDFQVKTHVEEVNGMTREIASLNEKIHAVEVTGAHANDERDRREVLLKQLGEKINIRYAEGDNGMVTVSAGTSVLLVAGQESKNLEVIATPEREGKREANVDIFYRSNSEGQKQMVTGQIDGGMIGGLLETRDKTINELLDKVNNLATTIADNVNEIHQQGFDIYNNSGHDFFEIDERAADAAEGLRIHAPVREDVGLISAAATPRSPGDNRIANMISALQYQPLIEEGSASVDEYYNSMVGEIGVEARRAESSRQMQSDILRQLRNLRESISGVSLDEEATKIIEYQKAFDASARLIRTADEMFDTVLSLKR